MFKKVLQELLNQNEIDVLTFFKLVNKAYSVSTSDHVTKETIFYHIHNPDIFARLNFYNFARDSRWIILVREPYKAVSLGLEEILSN